MTKPAKNLRARGRRACSSARQVLLIDIAHFPCARSGLDGFVIAKLIFVILLMTKCLSSLAREAVWMVLSSQVQFLTYF